MNWLFRLLMKMGYGTGLFGSSPNETTGGYGTSPTGSGNIRRPEGAPESVFTGISELLPGSENGNDFLDVIKGFIQKLADPQIIDQITGKYNTDMTNKSNKEMAEYAYSKDLEMWNLQNEYNSPEKQMQRLKGAGLNPRLMYGSGTNASVAAGQAKEMPKYQAPRMEYNYQPQQLMSVLNTFQDTRVKSAQSDLVKTQMDNVREETFSKALNNMLTAKYGGDLKKYEAKKLRFDAWKSHQDAQFAYDTYNLRGKVIAEELNLLEIEREIMRAEQQLREGEGMSYGDRNVLRFTIRALRNIATQIQADRDQFKKRNPTIIGN